MTARRVVVEARAAGTPAVAAQQIRRHAAFVEKDVLAGSRAAAARPPLPPLRGDVRAPLFVGVYGFF